MVVKPKTSIKKKRKEEALFWAENIYYMYKEDQANGKIKSGQNDVQQTPKN